MGLAGFLEILRPKNCLMASAAVAIGFFVSAGQILFTGKLLLAMISAFMVCGAGQAINDYFDTEVDAKKKQKRAITGGKIKPFHALLFSAALFFSGTTISFFISLQALAISALFSLLLFFYSMKMGKIKIAGNIVVALGTAITLIFGATITGNYLVPALFASSAFFANLGREMTKDIQDKKADSGVKKTIAHVLPEKKVHALIFFFYACAGAISIAAWAWKKSTNIPFLVLVLAATAIFVFSWHFAVHGRTGTAQSASKAGMAVSLLAFMSWVVF